MPKAPPPSDARAYVDSSRRKRILRARRLASMTGGGNTTAPPRTIGQRFGVGAEVDA